MTFTNKAAGEMRERIARLARPRRPTGMWCGTFHAIGARMLRARAAPRRPHAELHDLRRGRHARRHQADDGARSSISPKQFTPRGDRIAISDAKNALVTPAEYASAAMDPFSQRGRARSTPSSSEALRAANAVDFDDLLVLPVRLLAEQPATCSSSISDGSSYMLVDEYQDTNRAQYQFIKLLGGGHGNVCVVGDDDQSIYGWRGADIRNILDFEKDFPSARVVRLEENYRSTPGSSSWRTRRSARTPRAAWARRCAPRVRRASA